MNTRYLLISSAIAGTLSALLTAVPVLNFFNCLLCGWLWAGGMFAVWMYRSNTDEVPQGGQAVTLGLVTGLFGAAVATIINALLGATSAPVPPETMQQLEQMFGENAAWITNPATTVTVSLVFNLILYPLFGAIGGLLGAVVFKPRTGGGGQAA